MTFQLPLSMTIFADELLKLSNADYGRLITKRQMARDKLFEARYCFSAFVKRDIRTLPHSFFNCVRDKDCTPNAYSNNYDKPIDDTMKKVAIKYAPDKDILLISPLETDSPSKCQKYSTEIFYIYIQHKYSMTLFFFQWNFKYSARIFGRYIRWKYLYMCFTFQILLSKYSMEIYTVILNCRHISR